MSARKWYRRCAVMAAAAVVLSAVDALTPGGVSFQAQFAAAILLIGAGLIAYMTRTAP